MKEFVKKLAEKFINDCAPILSVICFFVGGMVGIWISRDIGGKLGLTGFAFLLLWSGYRTD